MPSFACPHCSRRIRAPGRSAGQRGRCPNCGEALTVPAAKPSARRRRRAVTVQCPCGERFGAPPAATEQKVTCPGCGRTLRVRQRTTRAGPGQGAPQAAERSQEPKGLSLAEEDQALWAEELGEGGTPCPSCGEPVPEGAALCTSCGLNLESGRRQMTKVRAGVADEAEEIRSWVSGVSLILPFAIVPYRTTEADEKPRWANVALVVLTVATSAVALVMLLGDNLEPLRYALWPGPRFAAQQLVTHLFLHGGLAHLVGNMIFLWVFGSAINRELGSAWYPATYLALGMLAGYCGHVLPAKPGTEVPLIGASGAISALSGLYLVLFPRHDIHMAVWFRLAWWMRPWIKTFAVTGIFAVLFYVAFDVAAVALGWTGNVAHWVHLSGFAWGILLGLALLLTGAVKSEGYDLLTWLLGDRWKRLSARA